MYFKKFGTYKFFQMDHKFSQLSFLNKNINLFIRQFQVIKNYLKVFVKNIVC